MKRGKNSYQKKTREEANWEGSSWAVWDLDAYRKKDAARIKELLIQQHQSPLKCAKMLHILVTTGVSSLMEKPWRRVWIPSKLSMKEDICDSWLS